MVCILIKKGKKEKERKRKKVSKLSQDTYPEEGVSCRPYTNRFILSSQISLTHSDPKVFQ